MFCIISDIYVRIYIRENMEDLVKGKRLVTAFHSNLRMLTHFLQCLQSIRQIFARHSLLVCAPFTKLLHCTVACVHIYVHRLTYTRARMRVLLYPHVLENIRLRIKCIVHHMVTFVAVEVKKSLNGYLRIYPHLHSYISSKL